MTQRDFNKLLITLMLIMFTAIAYLTIKYPTSSKMEIVPISNNTVFSGICEVTPKLDSIELEGLQVIGVREPYVPYVTDEEIEHIAKLVYAEARGEDIHFKCLIARVVLNQLMTGKYGESVDDVIFYKNNYSVVKSGAYSRAKPDDSCYEAIQLVLDGWDESQGATYFRVTDHSRTSWHDKKLMHLFDYSTGSFYKER